MASRTVFSPWRLKSARCSGVLQLLFLALGQAGGGLLRPGMIFGGLLDIAPVSETIFS